MEVTVAHDNLDFEDSLLGFSGGASPAKSLTAKVGEKPGGKHDGGKHDGGKDDGGKHDGGKHDGGKGKGGGGPL